MFKGARILIAPLDWGLGHATRCIPIVRALRKHGATVVLGADGAPLALLQQEFPDLEHVRIPGVQVRYSRSNDQRWSMAKQFPAMVHSVRTERMLFERELRPLKLHAVISDQRFGLRSPDLHSVIITHQVFPFTPLAQKALRRLNRYHLERFDRCWIMDEPAAPGLAGELAHGTPHPANARYIGTVSRMGSSGPSPSKGYEVVAVISGPEPQRTLLEERLLDRLHALPGRHLLVVGQPHLHKDQHHGNVHVRSHLDAEELESRLRSASLIVSRSGYTTLMDLAAIGRSALIIPTPGQAEQEYLGDLHQRTGRFVVQHQDAIDLPKAMAQVSAAEQRPAAEHNTLLEQALEELAATLG